MDYAPGMPEGTFSMVVARHSLGLSLADEVDPQVCSMHSGNGIASSRFQIVDHHVGRNDIELRTYAALGDGGSGEGSAPITNWSWTVSNCGDLTLTPSGIPTLGGRMSLDVQGGGAFGIVIGAPSSISLAPIGCACTLGVNNGVFHPGPVTWAIPANRSYIGMTLAAQALTFRGTNCLGTMDLSDTVTFTIR